MKCDIEDSSDYLESVIERVLDYDDTRFDVITYLLENNIKEEVLATDLFIMAFLWKAAVRKESLSINDIVALINTEADATSVPDISEINLDQSLAGMTLQEVLDTTLKKKEK